ncbi:hypothetical protein DRQ09_04615 [candidate division KSB1 bacterium]|nr:MAG: hypothetical protein DRQ09_04615 [candidate division KSB1 bacterium]
MLNRLLVVGLLLLLIPALVFASDGTTGKLAGRAIDKATGEPLPGVNITIENTTLGAATDQNGNYFINNIPAGTYTVVASYIGYEKIRVENVKILPDYTTKRDFEMVETQIEGEVVVVTAERPLIQQDVTNTVRIATKEEIDQLPTRGTGSVVQLQTGVVNYGYGGYRIRGGRGDEVTYIVDGFEVQSYYGGGSSFSVNNAAISQLQVSTGGFNAEYGRQMSGAVNVVTRSGSPDYHGSIQAITDALAGDWMNTYNYGYNVYDFSFSGRIPFTGRKGTFYISGEREWKADRAPRPFVDRMRDDLRKLYVPKTETDYWTKFPEGRYLSVTHNPNYYQDGRIPDQDLSAWHWHGKFNYRLTNSINLEAGFFGRKHRSSSYWYRGRFDLTQNYSSFFRNNVAYIKATHTLSSKTFYTIGFNYSFENSRGYASKHGYRISEYYRSVLNQYDELRLYYDPYADEKGLIRSTSFGETHFAYMTIKGDVTSQINLNHQLQAGFDFQRHTLRSFSMGGLRKAMQNPQQFTIQNITSWGFDWPRDKDGSYKQPDVVDTEIGGVYYYFDPNHPYFTENVKRWGKVNSGVKAPKNPIQFALYLQDKIEYEGLVINAGIRFDYYDPDSPVILDYNEPIDPETNKLKIGDKQVSQRISPRLGLGFPVTDRTLLHVNYGKFYQMPTWNRIIIGYDTFEDRAKRGSIAYSRNPRLKPETTTAYEAGVTQQLGEYFRMDFTAYYKDVLDLVIRERVASLLGYFSQYKNGDFGTLKGFDFGITLRRYHNISIQFAYSLGYALGTGSTSDSNSRVIWIGATPPSQTYPLDYDQRHKISVSLDYRVPRDGGPVILGRKIFSDAGINVVFNGGSGFPYTPCKQPNNRISLQADAPVNDGPINSSYGPWLYDINIKANKIFRVTSRLKVNAYIWAMNVMDRINPYRVYPTTGDWRSTGWLDTKPGKEWLAQYGEQARKLYEEVTLSPFNFRAPRQVRFGLELIF